MLIRKHQMAWLTAATAAVASCCTAHAQSLCDDFHVPAAHIGNVESCVFDGNNTTTITLNAPAILEWNRGFRPNANQHLHFAFPNFNNGAVLNRDLSGGPSNISGRISSNGRVMLINPTSDILIQNGALIEAAGGFLASTLDSVDDEALLAGDEVTFQGNRTTAVDNRGTIHSTAGDIVLLGGSVNNFAPGRIITDSGSVHIGAGSRIRLAAAGETRITVLETADLHTIHNSGHISASHTIDLSVLNTEMAANDDDPTIVNHGTILAATPTGRVFLRAVGGGQFHNSPRGDIGAAVVATEGFAVNDGSIRFDDGSNLGTPTGTRQFPRLTTGDLANTANADFRLSRLSFSHLNGLESKNAKKPKRSTKKKASTVATTTTRGSSDNSKKRSTSSGKKIVLRRGAFFGKKSQ